MLDVDAVADESRNVGRVQSGKLTIVPKTPGELARGRAAMGADPRSGNALTRRAGGHELIASRGAAGAAATPRRVIVDVREFMSSLPAVLYSRGMEVVPVTLEVGDFVVSPDICVERKAVPDLISSLDSGRLYTQAVAMCRHYKTPVLLIEFDPGRAFALQSAGDLGLDIRGNNVASKLVILLLNFPKIRCVPGNPSPPHAAVSVGLTSTGASLLPLFSRLRFLALLVAVSVAPTLPALCASHLSKFECISNIHERAQ